MPGSKRSSINRSSKGFQHIPNQSDTSTMSNPNDATISIPMSNVNNSKTGARKTDSYTPTTTGTPEQQLNEKAGFYQRHVAGRRRTEKKTGKKNSDGEEEIITQMGMIYNKILNFSVVTRYFLYVLPLATIIATPIIIGATAAQNATLGGVRIVWIFSWLECVWLSLWVSKLAAKTLPWIFEFLCGIVSSGTRKYSLVIQSLEIYLSLCGWALASLATFAPVMTRNPTQRSQQAKFTQAQHSTNTTQSHDPLLSGNGTGLKEWESIVQKILAAFLVASVILLAEKVLIQLLSISYHHTQFHAKIKDSKHRIYLLSLLYDASRHLFPAYCNEFAEEDYIIHDSIDIPGSKHGQKHSGSATPMKLLMNVGRFGDKLTSAFGNIASEVTGKQVFNPDSAHSIVVEALEKNKSSEALAKRLWMSFVVEGKEALFADDVVEVLGADHHDEAEEAFAILDRDGNGDISLDEMILTVCEFGKERHSIASSLHDVDQAISVLDSLLCTIVLIVVAFIFVAFLNSSLTTTLATAGTALLSLSFVFATTCQEVLGSCIFLFVKHPFDVLDRVDIGDDQLVVKHISLLFTVFKHVNTHKLTQVPNIVLNTMWVQNVSRSDAMREQLSIYIDFGTTLEDVQLLRNEMQAFVTDKENSRDFQPDIDVEITGIASMDKMELKVEIRHKSNWSNETVRAARRSKFMCALVLALRKIPINAPGGAAPLLGSADQPTYSVTVSDAQAAANREAAAKAQDAQRLFPVNKPDLPAKSRPAEKPDPPAKTGQAGVTSGAEPNMRDSVTPPPLRFRHPAASESNALATLNSRRPAADTAHTPGDLLEPTTPNTVAHSVSTMDVPDYDRTVSIEEVRGLLRRQSTRGKRRASSGAAKFPRPPVSTSNLAQPPPSLGLEYDPYAYTSQQPSRLAQPPKAQTPPQSRNGPPPLAPPKDSPTQWPQPPQSALSQSQVHAQPQPGQLQNQQRPPPPAQSQPRQAPPIAPPAVSLQSSSPQSRSRAASQSQPQPPPKPAPINTSNLAPSPTDEPSRTRTTSPVRNPFQINALRSQAQGTAPQLRRPVPGSGTASPREPGQIPATENGAGVVRPPRGDSLAGAPAGMGDSGGA